MMRPGASRSAQGGDVRSFQEYLKRRNALAKMRKGAFIEIHDECGVYNAFMVLSTARDALVISDAIAPLTGNDALNADSESVFVIGMNSIETVSCDGVPGTSDDGTQQTLYITTTDGEVHTIHFADEADAQVWVSTLASLCAASASAGSRQFGVHVDPLESPHPEVINRIAELEEAVNSRDRSIAQLTAHIGKIERDIAQSGVPSHRTAASASSRRTRQPVDPSPARNATRPWTAAGRTRQTKPLERNVDTMTRGHTRYEGISEQELRRLRELYNEIHGGSDDDGASDGEV